MQLSKCSMAELTAVAAPTRRLPIGAEVTANGVHFRVWTPSARRVLLELDQGEPIVLTNEHNGYHSGTHSGAHAGTRYRFMLDERGPFPDPASRYQPQGPHGWSQVIDPQDFRWNDKDWPGPGDPAGLIYELHFGTFTQEGTYRAATQRLDHLRNLGVSAIEVMPLAEFPGRFGWGYDGVDFFAPSHLYGTPDELRAFVDQAHARGMAVLNDVVYNHVGPDGNYLAEFSPSYFTDRYKNDWGKAINYDGQDAAPVREFCLRNAFYWIDEFHMDGLRLDATQQIFDASQPNIMAEIVDTVRDAAQRRSTLIVAENEPQRAILLTPPSKGGYGIDKLWNDDFHHSARVAATGIREAYYSGYRGTASELLAATRHGFLYQGQPYAWQKNRRGTSALHLPHARLINFLDNHDQVANSLLGKRIHQLSSPGNFRALTALLLLAPGTPMLFQGQEFAASSPFLYFADHNADLAQLVRKGRFDFLKQFPSLASPEAQAQLDHPEDPQTFERCKLNWSECALNGTVYSLHRDLLELRRSETNCDQVDGAVLTETALLLRFMCASGLDRLLLINLGADIVTNLIAEPLIAPPQNHCWTVRWSSEEVCYGGRGSAPVETDSGWRIPGNAAVLLTPLYERERA